MITFDKVSKVYPDGAVAVDKLTISAPNGKIAVLVGPSGCGKTTSMRMINRLIEPTLLNALVNTASGASWVSIHHGGGVGMGRSIHAGQVCVADGTDLAAQKLSRVLVNDPGMGVIRHVDAGYEHAAEVARARGVRIPMWENG